MLHSFPLTTAFQHHTRCASEFTKIRKGNEGYKYWEGTNKTVHRCHNYL